jgi:hypothetical protein
MHSRTHKYHGEQDDRHGAKLHWPGVNGVPFRGTSVPNIKQNELEDLPVVGEAFEQTFDLSDKDQAEAYRWIRDRVRNGMFTQDYVYRYHGVDEETGELKTIVYIEWTQLYVQLPPNHSAAGVNGNGRSGTNFTIRGN